MSDSKSHLIAAALCLTMLTMGATESYGATITLDFETLPDATPTEILALVGNGYQSLGVVFSSHGEADTSRNPIFGGFALVPSTTVADLARDVGSSFNIRADFLNGTSIVSADTYAATGRTMTMSAFGSSDNLLGSATTGPYTLGVSQFLSLSGIGTISYVIWETNSPFSAAPAIDNLTFEASVVPVPAALPLLASGLGGLGLMGWWRRRRYAALPSI